MPDGNTAFPKPILSEAYKFKEAIPKIQSKTSDVINKRWVTVTKKSCSEQSTKDVEKNLKNGDEFVCVEHVDFSLHSELEGEENWVAIPSHGTEKQVKLSKEGGKTADIVKKGWMSGVFGGW